MTIGDQPDRGAVAEAAFQLARDHPGLGEGELAAAGAEAQGSGHGAGLSRSGSARRPRGPPAAGFELLVVVELEQLAGEVEALQAGLAAVARGAQLHARVVQDLAHQRAGEAVEVVVGLGGEALVGVLQLAAADALGLLLQPGDQRLGLQRAVPAAEAGELLRR